MLAIGGGAVVMNLTEIVCAGYRMRMSPWRCLQNQLSDYCLPGWPCWTCDTMVTLALSGEGARIRRGADLTVVEPKPGGKTGRKQERKRWPPGMSKAVALAEGLVK